MRELAATSLLVVLLVTLVTPAYAFVTIQTTVNQDLHVTFDFGIINATIYEKAKNSIVESTIPNIILDNLRQQNLTQVYCYTEPLVFNDSAQSIRVTFHLYGSDILNFTVNVKSMNRTYYLRTDWRKFYVNITNGFSLNFTKYFDRPISHSPPSPPSLPWQILNYTDLEGKIHRAYFCNYTELSSSDPLCYFILPTTASNIHAVGDTIIFELPPSFEDSLLNSPFLVLGALIVVNLAVFLYRKVRK